MEVPAGMAAMVPSQIREADEAGDAQANADAQAQKAAAQAELARLAAPVPVVVPATPEVKPVEPPAPLAAPAAAEPKPVEHDASETERLRQDNEIKDKEIARFRSAHRAIAGKYSAEVPRMAKDLRESKEREAQYQQRIRELETRGTATTATADDVALTEDEKNLGVEVDSLATKRARAVETRLRKEYDAKFAEMETRLKATAPSAPTPEQTAYFDTLTTLTPDWEAINKDPAFAAWLDGKDAAYGPTRRQLAGTAANTFDAVTVSDIFEAYRAKAPRGAVAPAGAASVASQTAPETRSRAATEPPAKKTYSEKEYTQLQTDIMLGRNGMTGERGRLMALELEAAEREGRLVA